MIGILGGGFDPIHFGHINPLYKLLEEFDFNEIRLVPTKISPTNKIFYANEFHRLSMVSIITSSNTNNFIADDIELKNNDISYTYSMLNKIKKNVSNEKICLIMGLDVFLNIKYWYNYLKIINEFNLIVINRPDFDFNLVNNMDISIKNMITKNKKDLFLNNHKNIYLYDYDMPSINISSTKIRCLISTGIIPRGFLPGSVMTYIKRNNLYTNLL